MSSQARYRAVTRRLAVYNSSLETRVHLYVPANLLAAVTAYQTRIDERNTRSRDPRKCGDITFNGFNVQLKSLGKTCCRYVLRVIGTRIELLFSDAQSFFLD